MIESTDTLIKNILQIKEQINPINIPTEKLIIKYLILQ